MDAYSMGYRRAARHLLASGLLPYPCRRELQAMWTASGTDRAIVREVCENWEVTPT